MKERKSVLILLVPFAAEEFSTRLKNESVLCRSAVFFDDFEANALDALGRGAVRDAVRFAKGLLAVQIKEKDSAPELYSSTSQKQRIQTLHFFAGKAGLTNSSWSSSISSSAL